MWAKEKQMLQLFPAVAFVKMHIVVGKVDLLTCAKADKLEKAL